MNRVCPVTRYPHGLSIVELMVAIAIGAFLMMGVVSIFVSNKQTYEVNDDLSRLQENARFAVNLISRDIRMAGYYGCHFGESPENTLGLDAGSLGDTTAPIEGLDSSDVTAGDGWHPSDNTDDVPAGIVAGTDAITVRYASGTRYDLAANLATVSQDIGLAAGNELDPGDLIAIGDCSSTDIVAIDNAAADDPTDTGLIEHDAALTQIYDAEDTQLSRLVAIRYFIQNSAGGDDYTGPSLWRSSLADAGPVELIEGIENMQILYGVDTSSPADGVPDAYLNAADVGANWGKVVSVRIGILARTVDEYGTDTDPNGKYRLFGSTSDASNVACDGEEGCVDVGALRGNRRVFTSTIVLRNQ